MLYILFITTFLFFILNFCISKGDYLHPSVVFSATFLLFELQCIINKSEFSITIHAQTVLVITFSLLVFTVVSILSKTSNNQVLNRESTTISPIIVSSKLIILLIIFQIFVIMFFIKYLRDISIAYYGKAVSLPEMINLYDKMIKFLKDEFYSLNVSPSIIYRVGYPISNAAAFLVIYIVVNNYVALKKINKLYIIPIILLCVFIILNGSRSPLFVVLTMIIILHYIMNKQNVKKTKFDFKFLFKTIIVMIIATILFITMLGITGRISGKLNIKRYLFIYVGAQIVNLDNYLLSLDNGIILKPSELFGAQTFKGLYQYIGKILNIDKFFYSDILMFTSSNGIGTGNVYTTFHSFIYDFGYAGVFPLISIIAIYYNFTYKSFEKKKRINHKVNYRLFIYSYLFNDLIMLPFSNRFYESLTNPYFLKVVLFAWLFDYLFIEKSAKTLPFLSKAQMKNELS